MNLDKLIEAAKEIDRLAKLQEERSKKLQQLASKARKYSDEGRIFELRAVQSEAKMLSITVVDFSNAINDLRRALKARPKKMTSKNRTGGDTEIALLVD